MRRLRIDWPARIAAVLLVLAVTLTAAAAAGSQDAEQRKELLARYKAWRELQTELNAMTFTIGAGYIGDASSERELNKLDVNAALAKSGYPNDLKFSFASSIQLKHSGSKTDYLENVTTLLLSYEHRMLPWLKAYAFVERFTDTYLSIQQRYESGLGVKGELEIGLTETGRKKIEDVQAFARAAAEARDRKLAGGEDVAAAQAVEDGPLEDAVAALRNKYSRLTLGLACTTLAEIERASIDLPDGSARLIDPRRGFRLALRPDVILRPSESLTLRALTYFKLPAFGPTHAFAFDGTWRYDIRTDTNIIIRYDLPKAPAWARRVSLVLDYKYFFDNLPPYVPGIKSAAAAHNSLVFRIQAEI